MLRLDVDHITQSHSRVTAYLAKLEVLKATSSKGKLDIAHMTTLRRTIPDVNVLDSPSVYETS